MKKFIFTLLQLFFAYISYATYTASLTAGFFYNNSNQMLEFGKAAWVIDTQASDFSDFELGIGEEFAKGSFLDPVGRYYVLDVADLDSSIAYLYSDIDLNSSEFSVNDTFAVICWNDNGVFIERDTEYIVFADPSWIIPQSTGFVDFEALTVLAGGVLPEDALVLDKVVVPESAKIGSILGAIAAVIVSIRARTRFACCISKSDFGKMK